MLRFYSDKIVDRLFPVEKYYLKKGSVVDPSTTLPILTPSDTRLPPSHRCLRLRAGSGRCGAGSRQVGRRCCTQPDHCHDGAHRGQASFKALWGGVGVGPGPTHLGSEYPLPPEVGFPGDPKIGFRKIPEKLDWGPFWSVRISSHL